MSTCCVTLAVPSVSSARNTGDTVCIISCKLARRVCRSRREHRKYNIMAFNNGEPRVGRCDKYKTCAIRTFKNSTQMVLLKLIQFYLSSKRSKGYFDLHFHTRRILGN